MSQVRVIDGIEVHGFPWSPERSGLVVNCYFWLENDCSFEDHEWYLTLSSWKGEFSMYQHPQMLDECLLEQLFNPDPEVLYLITFELWREDDGFPQITSYFKVSNIQVEKEVDDAAN